MGLTLNPAGSLWDLAKGTVEQTLGANDQGPSPPKPQAPKTTQTMISPKGRSGEVPVERVDDAVKLGFKHATTMYSPSGKQGYVPNERVEEAKKKGFSTVQSPYSTKWIDTSQSIGVLGRAALGVSTLAPGGEIEAAGSVGLPSMAGVGATAGAPVRFGARTLEDALNSRLPGLSSLRIGKNINVPADEATALRINVPGRNLGLPPSPEPLPYSPLTPFKAKAEMDTEMALRSSAPFPQTPPQFRQSPRLGKAPWMTAEQPTLAPNVPARPGPSPAQEFAQRQAAAREAATRPEETLEGRITGMRNLVLSPEEARVESNLFNLAKKRASERGTLFAGGMTPREGRSVPRYSTKTDITQYSEPKERITIGPGIGAEEPNVTPEKPTAQVERRIENKPVAVERRSPTVLSFKGFPGPPDLSNLEQMLRDNALEEKNPHMSPEAKAEYTSHLKRLKKGTLGEE